jgi:hypothetical protein
MTGPELRELRERTGLTRYQIGLLAGLSGNSHTIRKEIIIYERRHRQLPPRFNQTFVDRVLKKQQEPRRWHLSRIV